MERRQRWLEAQFRKHDECLTKIAKQLQVLQDFISLNFDSYRQYAVERERVDRLSHLSYGNVRKTSEQDPSHQQLSQSFQRPRSHSHHHHHHHHHHHASRLSPSGSPTVEHSADHYPSHHLANANLLSHTTTNNNNSDESEFEDGDTMDPAPENDPGPHAGPVGGVVGVAALNPLSIVAVDLSTERRSQLERSQQEPNSTVADYITCSASSKSSGTTTAGYFEFRRSECDELTLPDSGVLEEEPTDLSTERKTAASADDTYSFSGFSPPYHVSTHGSILGGILTSHIQPKVIKAEIKEEDEPSPCYGSFTRSRTGSMESTSKDKYTAPGLWSAGAITSITGEGGTTASTCSTDEVEPGSPAEQPLRCSKRSFSDEAPIRCKREKSVEFSHFLLTDSKSGLHGGIASAYSSSVEDYESTRSCQDESNVVMPRSTMAGLVVPGAGSPSTTTKSSCTSAEQSTSSTPRSSSSRTCSSGRKSNSNTTSNASKQCRYCGKTFQWLHSVKTHERLHTGIKPYDCKICGARFTQNGNLKVHAKTCVEKHADSYRSRNVLICSVCTEMFSDSNALMDHQKSHDRMQWTIKEKTCQLCGEVFQKRSYLLEHERVHVQDKSFLSSLGLRLDTSKQDSSSGAHAPTSSSEINVNNPK